MAPHVFPKTKTKSLFNKKGEEGSVKWYGAPLFVLFLYSVVHFFYLPSFIFSLFCRAQSPRFYPRPDVKP